jgi:hypothetical protein
MRLCRMHGATLLIAKLDRVSRNVAFLSNLMEAGASAGMRFHSSRSSLRVAEHLGLGRYSDTIEPEACFKFMNTCSAS